MWQPSECSPHPWFSLYFCLLSLFLISMEVDPGQQLAAASLHSQLGLTWESPSPAQVAIISDCFIVQTGWPWAKYRWELILACTNWETPGPAHPVDSYRPFQSTNTLPLHRWSSMGDRGWWSVVTASPCSWLAWVNPSHWPANSNQSPLQEEGVLSPHKGRTIQVLSLGDTGGCATGPYRTHTTLGHATKTGSHSSST